jgi:AraC family transcriptional activator of tynA and feaB
MTASIRQSVLDLARVDGHDRAALWMRSARIFFPGLSVTKPPINPAAGVIAGVPFGAGRLWSILSPPVLVSYVPCPGVQTAPMFSVMLQLEGGTEAFQNGHTCQLSPGEFCVIDGLSAFELQVSTQNSRVMVLQMPRHAVLSRRPDLAQRTARCFDPCEPGAILLRQVLEKLLETAPFLEPEQRAAVLTGVVHMLAAPKLPGGERGAGRNCERVASILAFIDAELANPALNAHRVAGVQGLSRRRLDQILLGDLGTSVSAQIWARRLTQAASDLLDSRFATKTVTQIAFGVGFEDAAHFARAFRRRYRCTPSDWRRRQMTLGDEPPPQLS